MLSFCEYRQEPYLTQLQPVEIDYPVTSPFSAGSSPPTKLTNTARTWNHRSRIGVQCDESGDRFALVIFKKVGYFACIDRCFDDRIHMARLWQCRSSRLATNVTRWSRLPSAQVGLVVCISRLSWRHSNTFNSMNTKATSHRNASQKSTKSPLMPQ